jgi:ketosteroid isomerase-like protein
MILFLALSLAAAPPAAASDPAQVIAAERAFAAMAKEKGIGPAFRTFSADDAIALQPDPVLLKPHLFRQGDPPGQLLWWPTYSGIAVSGDLGFNTGPFVSRGPDGGAQGQGWFFTIWKRQANGEWRWVLDHGAPSKELAAEAPDTLPKHLAPSTAPLAEKAGAWADLVAAEAELAAALAEDAHAALPAALADDGRVMRIGPQPALGRTAYTARVKEGPSRIQARHLGGGVSDAGDLAFTYGRADWTAEGGKAVIGNYVRVWQRQPEGWRIVIDEITAVPPRRPPPAPAPARAPAPAPAPSPATP